MCPSSWKSYVDDFPFFGSSLACLEPELELFEVDAVGDDDDLSHVYLPKFAHPPASNVSVHVLLLSEVLQTL